MSGHTQVDLSEDKLLCIGGLLEGFESELKRTPGVTCWRVMKEPGGHVTPWWLYARLNPGSAQIQFGETTHAAVDARPHMWVRGKDKPRNAGAALLRSWLARSEPLPQRRVHVPPPPSDPPPPPPSPPPDQQVNGGGMFVAFRRYNAKEVWGEEEEAYDGYLALNKGDRVTVLANTKSTADDAKLQFAEYVWGYRADDHVYGWLPCAILQREN